MYYGVRVKRAAAFLPRKSLTRKGALSTCPAATKTIECKYFQTGLRRPPDRRILFQDFKSRLAFGFSGFFPTHFFQALNIHPRVCIQSEEW